MPTILLWLGSSNVTTQFGQLIDEAAVPAAAPDRLVGAVALDTFRRDVAERHEGLHGGGALWRVDRHLRPVGIEQVGAVGPEIGMKSATTGLPWPPRNT